MQAGEALDESRIFSGGSFPAGTFKANLAPVKDLLCHRPFRSRIPTKKSSFCNAFLLGKILMKSTCLIMILLAASTLAFEPAMAASASPFDGTWDVSLNTPEYKDPTGVVSKAYNFQFPAHVKNGLLHGEHGNKGQPAWLVIDGQIDANGSALLRANGITGRPEYNLAHVETGRPYSYNVNAHFKGNRGEGHRIGGRIGNYTFVKQ
jgi:hypothetical protein